MVSRVHVYAVSLGLLLAAPAIAGGQSSQPTSIPSYEVLGFPITPHQISIVGSAHVEEQSPSPSLVMAGMLASPHQIGVLTQRSSLTAKAAAVTPTTVGRAAE